MKIATSLLVMLTAAAALAADCANCGGSRLVGSGPVHFACPVCEGTGTTASVEPTAALEPPAAASPAPGRPRPVVARISAADGPSRVYGSGCLVGASGTNGLVVTNWHVVRSHRDHITVTWPDGSHSRGRVVASDDAWDLAAVLVARPAAAPVAIAAAAPKLGDRLTIAGYGQGQYLEQTGPVTDYLSPTAMHERQFVELKAAARQGDSGGPMFTADGELAGVLFGERDGRTVGSCSTRVRLFLSDVPWPAAAACADGRCAKR